MAASFSSDWALSMLQGAGEPPFHRINTQGRADSSTPGPVARGPVQLQVRVDLQLDIQSLVAVCHFLQSAPNPEKKCPLGQPEIEKKCSGRIQSMACFWWVHPRRR